MEIKFLSKEELITNVEKFCDLYRSRFTDEINQAVVINRFIENPYEEIFVCVAEENGRYIANSSAMPTRIIFQGNVYKSALSINMMTHPDYAGQGLISKTVSALNNRLKEEDFKIVYGFPNYISNSILNVKFGRKDIYEIPTLEKDVKPCACSSIVRLCTFDKISDYKSNRIRIIKSKEYLDWRYSKNPHSKYNYVISDYGGWAIFKIYQDMINIVEIHPAKNEDIIEIISFIEHFAFANKLTKLTLWSMINTDEHCILEKMGFRNKYPITYFSALDFGFGEEAGVDIYDHRNWKINMGDDNVY